MWTSIAWREGMAAERRFQFAEPLFRPLADEFRGDVQIGGRAPVDLGRGLAAVLTSCETRSITISLGRSSAVNRRMRLIAA